MYTTCQRCFGTQTDSWNVKPAKFSVGRIEDWSVRMCPRCTELVEQALLGALKQASNDAERVG